MTSGPTQDEINKRLMDMAAMMAEPLHPDLVPYLHDDPTFGKGLYHPLVHTPLGLIPGHANMQYLHKKERIAKAIAAKDWGSVIGLHERPYRCDALIQYVTGRDEDGNPRPLLTLPREIRDVATDVWLDSENIHQHVSDWDHLFSGWEPGDELIIADADEQKVYDNLPDEFPIYRGDLDDGGWSWTLERKVAEFFAQRFGSHDLLEGTAEKRYVFGYIGRRGEAEVLIRREHVKDIRILEHGDDDL